MNRRELLKSSLAAGVGWSAQMAESHHFYELRTYQLRNDLGPARIQDFFQRHFLPMAKRQEIGPVGCFNVAAGLSSPALLVLIAYRSLAEVQGAMERQAADKEYLKAWQTFEAAAELPYLRYEATLLRAFDGHRKIEVPPVDAKRPGRLFELRTYESKNVFALRAKIEMFNTAEIKIFRDCGFAPVFFGEAIFGAHLPHLTYLVAFDDMAARDKAWDAFRANPDWARVRVRPGWTDAEAVSNIHASFLRPTNYSQIR
jgi:hypothetical protein